MKGRRRWCHLEGKVRPALLSPACRECVARLSGGRRAGGLALRLVSSLAWGCGLCSAGPGRGFSPPLLPLLGGKERPWTSGEAGSENTAAQAVGRRLSKMCVKRGGGCLTLLGGRVGERLTHLPRAGTCGLGPPHTPPSACDGWPALWGALAYMLCHSRVRKDVMQAKPIGSPHQ